MALFSRKNLKSNPFGLTEDDLKGYLEGFLMGVVVRMLEEQVKQDNKADVKVFQNELYSAQTDDGFAWNETEAGEEFWEQVLDYNIKKCNFNLFFKRYPDYKRYNLA